MVLFVFKMRILFCCTKKEYRLKAVSSTLQFYMKCIVLEETLTQDTRLKLVSFFFFFSRRYNPWCVFGLLYDFIPQSSIFTLLG